MKINKEHPKFGEFFDKWQKLSDEMNEKLSIVEAENKEKNYQGLDDKSCEITKEYAVLFNNLQKEYSFLYGRQ